MKIVENAPKLKPCPFCGSAPVLKQDTRFPRPACNPVKAYEVVCDNWNCIIYRADNKYSKTPLGAARKWNKRAEV